MFSKLVSVESLKIVHSIYRKIGINFFSSKFTEYLKFKWVNRWYEYDLTYHHRLPIYRPVSRINRTVS
jgi:hypothetical protein